MKKTKNTALTILSLLCAVLILCMGVQFSVPAYAEETETTPVEQVYNVGDLPYHTWYAEFGYYNAGNVEYVLKAGRFDATKADYGLTAFTTKVGDNHIATTLYEGMTVEDWRWSFNNGGSVVIEMKSKINGKITFNLSPINNGWMDGWNTIFSVHRKNADNTLTTFVDYFQGKDKVSQADTPSDLSGLKAILDIEVKVAVGDIVYYELGSLAERNVQGLTNATIEATPISDDPVINKLTELTPSWTKAYEALNEKHYTEENWNAVKAIYNSFIAEAKDCANADAVQELYNTKLQALNAVATDEVLVAKDTKLTALKEFYDSKTESDFTAENWLVFKGAYDEFVEGVEALTTVEDVNGLYDTKLATMNTVKAYKQNIKYLDYPSKMNANGYNWITGDVFDTKLYAGTVANKKEFDTQGDSAKVMYNKELNGESVKPAFYAENWKWFIGRDAGVIVAYKANANLKLTITDTRVASGSGNGWTDDCKLTYYIERNGVVKEIFQVNAPTADSQFSGDWYLKENDILYVEFVSFIIDEGTIRNTESPCNTVATADSTLFNEDSYTEQNHDLPKEVVDKIQEKLTALQDYVATLNEEDYSATNWLTIGDYVAQYIDKCDKEVDTVADVEELYTATLNEIKAVQTKAQATEELNKALNGYVEELQAEYDSLVSNYSFTKENKAKLDKVLEDGKTAINSAKSKSAGSSAKANAITALRAVEKTEKSNEKGCLGSITTVGGLFTLIGMIGAGIVAYKKKEND